MKKKNFGFTLVELLVAITIGILVVGFGSVALNEFNENQKVESTKQELLTNLRLARNYAATNQLPSGGNRVSVTINSSGLMTITTLDGNGALVGTFFSKDVTPNNVFITVNDPIVFSVSDGRSIGVTGRSISVGVSGVVVKNIIIEESGLIYEE